MKCPACGKRLVQMLYGNTVCEDPSCGQTPATAWYTWVIGECKSGDQLNLYAVTDSLAVLRAIAQRNSKWRFFRVELIGHDGSPLPGVGGDAAVAVGPDRSGQYVWNRPVLLHEAIPRESLLP